MIRLVEDVGAPVGVGVVNMLIDSYKPTWADGANIVMALGGLGASYMGYGGQIAKNVGIAATPAAFKAIVGMVKGAGVGTTASVRRRVGRWPAPPYEESFKGVRLD